MTNPISSLENDPLHAVLRVGVARPVTPRAVVSVFALSPDEALLLLGARPNSLHALSVSHRDGEKDLFLSRSTEVLNIERSAHFRKSAPSAERARERERALKESATRA